MTVSQTGPRRAPRQAAAAAFVGSALEYYDFFIFASAAALVFPRLFFPSDNPFVSSLVALATFGVGYVVRPVAALAFGHFGDRMGRKAMLVLTVIAMGASTFLIGVLPTYDQIGVVAPVLLILLRVVQGASAAGELPGAMATSFEHAADGRRALNASWTTSGVFAGATLASLVFLGVTALPTDAQLSWGWRLPFLFSAVVVAIGFIVRRRLPEPPDFEELRQANQTHRVPLAVVITRHWRTTLRVAGCTLVGTVLTLTIFVMSYSTRGLGVATNVILTATLLSQALAIGTQPLYAMLADRIGVKPVYMGGVFACGVLIFPYLAMIRTGSTVLIIFANILIISVAFAAQNAVIPTFFSEAFDTRVRYSGLALGNSIGLPVIGFAPAIAESLTRSGGLGLVAVFVAACCLTALLCAFFQPATVRQTRRIPAAPAVPARDADELGV
ncbi:MFS transporter [Streptomyces sp. E5N91]|uniref:MFS transporter n=1 Tax=Streptomyces sp. E5N91 TaxID=1851996 RepID=UPI000EF5FA98|nr:MFS transporter [Streptomyces sp. E5N91]